jgi:D-alanine-D-alanine ligase
MSGSGVLKALQSQGVNAFAFDPALRPLQELKTEGVDRCFIALHGRGGEDGTLQGALELLKIPYTGSGVMASSIAMDKIMTKRIWRFEGLPTPDWRMVASSEECAQALAILGAPMIVKPSREGSSIGLTKVTDPAQCAAAYAAAAQHDPEVLCEQFIDGEETTCPVLIVDGRAQALPLIRIVAPGGNYDYQNKYFTDDVKYLCPSQLDADEEAEIQRQVLRAFKTLGCRGWARADVMIRKTDRRHDWPLACAHVGQGSGSELRTTLCPHPGLGQPGQPPLSQHQTNRAARPWSPPPSTARAPCPTRRKTCCG